MKKWSYRMEALSAQDFNKENFVKELKDFLSQIGIDGWELVGITPTFMGATIVKDYAIKKCLLVFKKEI